MEKMFLAVNACGQGSFHMTQNTSAVIESDAAASSNSHKEAERCRRKRINGHIATLKSILPNVIKTDKASLLGETVRRVRELNKAAAELASLNFYFPKETDELKVCRCDDNSGLVKATLCCEDRPEIIVELMEALKSVQAKVVRAEMSTLGGRTMSVLWLQLLVDNNDIGITKLKRALKLFMDKSGHSLPVSKRIRYFSS